MSRLEVKAKKVIKPETEEVFKQIASYFPGNEDQATEILLSHYDSQIGRFNLSDGRVVSVAEFHREHKLAFEKRKKFNTPHNLKILRGSLVFAPGLPLTISTSEKSNLDRLDRGGTFTKRFT